MPGSELERARNWERDLAAASASVDGMPALRRLNAEWLIERGGELPADVRIEPVDVDGIPAEWTSVAGACDRPVVLFLHGGGYILGSAEENREWVSRVVRGLGGRALSIDYRLAPEHPYPAPVQDARAAYRWLLDRGVEPSEVALLGESAGGGLVAATLLALRDAGDPLPGAAVMLSPNVDLTLAGGSLTDNDDPFVTTDVLTMMVESTLQGQDPREHSPLFADLRGLPPLLVQVGTAEALYDDGRRFAEAAAAAGVEVTFEPWDQMIHLWHGFPYLPQARAAVERIAEYLRDRLQAAG